MHKTILITGANRGIGLELVKQYWAGGWQVYATCRAPEVASNLAELTSQSAGKIQMVPLDVLNEKSLARIKQMLKGEPLDLLFCNAGVYGPTKAFGAALGSIDTEAWEHVFKVNTVAPLRLVETFLPNLEQGADKKIAMMSSKMASISDNSSGGSYIYRSSKAALNAVTRSLAVDLADKNFKVVCVHPGWVQTDMGGENALISTSESVQGIKKLLDELKIEQSGYFWNFNGDSISW